MTSSADWSGSASKESMLRRSVSSARRMEKLPAINPADLGLGSLALPLAKCEQSSCPGRKKHKCITLIRHRARAWDMDCSIRDAFVAQRVSSHGKVVVQR